MRVDQRENDQLRPCTIEASVIEGPFGSARIECGGTKVICTASVDKKLPPFRRDSGKGWITAEYGMLPGCSRVRIQRDRAGRISGRTAEIQRLIGRSLRSVVDMSLMPEHTILVDCDVIQADGGTRTASITGAYVAVQMAFQRMLAENLIKTNPLCDSLAAVSVGVVGGKSLLDLCYIEDSKADVDMNVVMTGSGKFVEVQGTSEESPFDRDQLNDMLSLAEKGIGELFDLQKQALGFS